MTYLKQLYLMRSFCSQAIFSVLFFLLMAMATTSQAHLTGITDTSIQIGKDQIKIIYTFPKTNLHVLPGVEIAEEAINVDLEKQLIPQIAEGFIITNNKTRCDLKHSEHKSIDSIVSAQYTLLYQCAEELDYLRVQYELFIDQYPGHLNQVRLLFGKKSSRLAFYKDHQFVEMPVTAIKEKLQIELTNNFAGDPNQTLDAEDFSDAPLQTNYYPLGIEHILLGFDHVLFVLALILLPLKLSQLIALITSFTIAHSISLGAAVMGWATWPAQWVEALIALSIVYVAVENLWLLRHGNPAPSLNLRRLILTFAFGLIHGLGFSNVLAEIGLGEDRLSALLFFNLGVETGQLLIVIVCVPIFAWLFKHNLPWVSRRTGSVLILLAGLYWLFDRI